VRYLLAQEPTTNPDEQNGEQHAFVAAAMTTVCGLGLASEVLMRMPNVSWDERTSTAPVCATCVDRAV
jgi:hypothetical protein